MVFITPGMGGEQEQVLLRLLPAFAKERIYNVGIVTIPQGEKNYSAWTVNALHST